MNVPFDQKPVIAAIFIVTYLALAIGKIPGLRLNRTGIALLGAIAVTIFSGDSVEQAVLSINWPTITLLFGFFVISAQLRLSGFYDRVAVGISGRMSEPVSFLAYLIVATAVLSAFLNNDVVCLVLTPVVGGALVRRRIDPIPYLVAIAAASNIGAAATLIGNAQNMMIGSVANLSFSRYMIWSSVPVAIGLAGVFGVAGLACRGKPPLIPPEDAAPDPAPIPPLTGYHTSKGLVVLAVVVAPFLHGHTSGSHRACRRGNPSSQQEVQDRGSPRARQLADPAAFHVPVCRQRGVSGRRVQRTTWCIGWKG